MERKEQVEQARKLLAFLQSRTTAMAHDVTATRWLTTFARVSSHRNAIFSLGAALS